MSVLISRELISAGELAGALASEKPPRLLDVRWRLDRPDGRPAYREGHLPGAVYVDLPSELAAKGLASEGRHPLPGERDFEAAARRWGIRSGDSVVVYDDLGNLSAARAWWLLRYGGIADVRLLDGGLAAWREWGGEIEHGDVPAEPGDVAIVFGSMPVVTIEEVPAVVERGILLDARASDRYRGDTEPIDPKAGHIPGALSTPTSENLAPDGRFLSPEALRARFEAAGVRDGLEVATYCGSGVTAAHNLVALSLAGFPAALYPGSWSQWSSTEGLPVATGDEPGR